MDDMSDTRIVTLEITAADEQMERCLPVLLSALRNVGTNIANAGLDARILVDGEEPDRR